MHTICQPTRRLEPKKEEVDYQQLSAITQLDAYQLLWIGESPDALAGSKLFSTLDLLCGYWQVPLGQDVQSTHGMPGLAGIHTYHRAQVELSLTMALCQLWKINNRGITPYHPQSNAIVKRNKRVLGISLRALLLGQTQ